MEKENTNQEESKEVQEVVLREDKIGVFAEATELFLGVQNLFYFKSKYQGLHFIEEDFISASRLDRLVIQIIDFGCICQEISETILDTLDEDKYKNVPMSLEEDFHGLRLVSYLDEGDMKKVVELLGVSTEDLLRLYGNTYLMLMTGLGKISRDLPALLEIVRKTVWFIATKEKDSFIQKHRLSLVQVSNLVKRIETETFATDDGLHLQRTNDKYELVKSGDFAVKDIQLLEVALHRRKSRGGNIFTL